MFIDPVWEGVKATGGRKKATGRKLKLEGRQPKTEGGKAEGEGTRQGSCRRQKVCTYLLSYCMKGH